MYLVIKRSMLFGIFSNKKYMREAIEKWIKDDKETNGTPCGNYHFRYITFNADEPWFTKNGKYNEKVSKALFSLSTMHTESFTNEIETDWSTGEIIKL